MYKAQGLFNQRAKMHDISWKQKRKGKGRPEAQQNTNCLCEVESHFASEVKIKAFKLKGKKKEINHLKYWLKETQTCSITIHQ